MCGSLANDNTSANIASFVRRAEAGNRLNVVFVGGSVTWGAGASDPHTTSYRAILGSRLKRQYPLSDIRLHDAAIGGTGSQIGAFRLDRDVISHKPDMVFLEFTLNDNSLTADKETLASYEAVLRRILLSGSSVLQVMLPTEFVASTTGEVLRRDAHIQIADVYGTGVSDVISQVRELVNNGASRLVDLWPNPNDGSHPGDAGYKLFADIIWADFMRNSLKGATVHLPDQMLHGSTYMRTKRIPFTDIDILPKGWVRTQPRSDSPIGDFVMSRWLDEEVTTSFIDVSAGEPEDLCIEFKGSRALLFAESTLESGKYLVRIDDGEPLEFDAAKLARDVGSGGHHFPLLGDALDPQNAHLLRITPILKPGQELRLESLGVAI